MIDLQPLLNTLAAVSDNRVLPFADIFHEGEITRVMIPVGALNHGDQKDTVLRQFATDWLRTHHEERIGVDARYQPMPPGQSFHRQGAEYPVVAALVLIWWPKPQESEFDAWRRQQREARAS